MATNKLSTLCEEKIKELRSSIEKMKTNKTLSKATRGTQLYKMGRERRVLHLIKSLVEQCDSTKLKLSEDDMNTFTLITTLISERTPRSSVECKEGDSITELLTKYAEVRDVYGKLTKYCESHNLVMDCANNKIVKPAAEAVKPAAEAVKA